MKLHGRGRSKLGFAAYIGVGQLVRKENNIPCKRNGRINGSEGLPEICPEDPEYDYKISETS